MDIVLNVVQKKPKTDQEQALALQKVKAAVPYAPESIREVLERVVAVWDEYSDIEVRLAALASEGLTEEYDSLLNGEAQMLYCHLATFGERR